MNADRFDRELDAVLVQAAGSLALARDIEDALMRVAADKTPERPWRP